MKRMNRFFTTLLGMVLISAMSVSAQDLSTLTTPVTTPDGEQTSVADIGAEKVTIVSFWATWCKPCKEEMKAISGMYDDLSENGVEYIAVSIDNTKTSARVAPYVKAKGYEFPVVLDTNSELFQAVNGTEVPYTLVYDAAGTLRFKHQGYFEGDEEHLREEAMGLVAEASETSTGATEEVQTPAE